MTMTRRLFIDASGIQVAEASIVRLLRDPGLDDEQARRRVEDALELWIAALLAVHPRWTLEGRWFDGLLLEGDVLTDDGRSMRGFIYTIEAQRKVWFSAIVSAAAGTLDFALEVVDPATATPALRIRRTPRHAPFPLHRWGAVADDAISAVRVDVAGGGFAVITVEPRGTFDVWVEREADVVEALRGLAIAWDPAGLEIS